MYTYLLYICMILKITHDNDFDKYLIFIVNNRNIYMYIYEQIKHEFIHHLNHL